MFAVGEVTEIKKAFKPNQKDDEGNPLPLGSIRVRLGGQHRISGNIRHVWARPFGFNRRIPLRMEQVVVGLAPAHDNTDGIAKTNDYYYFSPMNASDDLVLHQLPKTWWRHKGSGAGGGQGDNIKPGMNFPMVPKKVDNIQPYAGDDVWESRFGGSIRLGQSIQPIQGYAKPPTWQGSNGDPINIIRVSKSPAAGGAGAKYTVEDLSKDDSSIYMTTTQKLLKAKVGFTKSLDSMKAPTISKPQIYLDADRITISGKNDMVIINGKKRVVVAGKTVYLQSQKHMVDLDDLMEYIKDILKQLNALVSGQATFATPSGPTAVATNLPQVMKLLQVDFNTKFKIPK